ncbi:MAG: FkbM family methyltransferase [Oscillospiraceae bacterium]
MFSYDYFNGLESCWDRLKQTSLPIYIYGMGDGCEKILRVFNTCNIKCSGIFASDEFLRGQEFAGFKVCSYGDVKEKNDKFVVVPAFGTSLSEVMQRIESIADEQELIMPDVPVIGKEVFSKEKFLENFHKANRVYELLADEQSRKVFESVFIYKITGNIRTLKQVFTMPDEVYNNILKFDDKEIYVDLGAFTGDTVKEFLSHTNNQYEKIYAFEPDKKNFRKCVKNLLSLDNIELFNSAVWEKDQVRIFSGNAGRQGKLSDAGKTVLCRSVDSVLNGRPCTYIKYDVEGAEKAAINGSRNTLERYSPKLCAAVYHRAYDMIDIPLQINEINPEYKIFMRQYSYYPAWETNVFCV